MTKLKQYSRVKYAATVLSLLKAWTVRQINGQPTQKTELFLAFRSVQIELYVLRKVAEKVGSYPQGIFD